MNCELVHDWADLLSSHLNRPRADILQRGLAASDFREDVEISFPDGSTVSFRHAFFVIDSQRQVIAVFTEHCGYHVFPAADSEIYRVRREWVSSQ
jgi:hypothetical protein